MPQEATQEAIKIFGYVVTPGLARWAYTPGRDLYRSIRSSLTYPLTHSLPRWDYAMGYTYTAPVGAHDKCFKRIY